MHVDGFRFDLGVTLGREAARLRSGLGLLRRDPPGSAPVARQADRRALGHRARRLPARAASRRAGPSGTTVPRRRAPLLARRCGQAAPSFAARLAGSADLFDTHGRRPWASINFVTAHDGFTLSRPVSYNEQAQRGQRRGQPRRPRRELLLELRRRGADRRSRDPRTARPAEAHLLATLFLSQGTPMLLPATSSAAPSTATTTPTARTTRSPGSTGTGRSTTAAG